MSLWRAAVFLCALVYFNVVSLMPSASFNFGSNLDNEVKVVCGLLGSEKYFVNGVLALSCWSLWPSGIREFEANGQKVRILIAMNFKEARGQAFVDGILVAADLFAAFNTQVASRRSQPRSSWLAKVAASFIVSFVVFTTIKYFERKSNPSPEKVTLRQA